MRFRRIALPLVAAVLGVVASAGPAAAAVAISAPPTVNLGTATPGSGASRVMAQIGPVTVTGSGLTPPSFVATVSVSVFKTGSGGPGQTIPPTAMLYWSGPATSAVGLKSGGSPGQRNANQALDLSAPRVAFSGEGSALAISVSWNPTLIIDVPQSVVPGTYTGTITHSVA